MKVKIGKDEIGPAGLIALILYLPSGILTFYGALFGPFFVMLLGIICWAISAAVYYADLQEHRKQKARPHLPPPPLF